MSQENVGLVRRAFDAFNRRDLDTMLALVHERSLSESRLVAMEGGLLLAVFDVPHGAVRRPLTNGETLSPQRRDAVEAAARVVLAVASR